MAEEIEYKFLVDAQKWASVKPEQFDRIVQGFIYKSVESTIRIRILNDQGFITIKGKSKGIRRSEFEYEIPLNDAQNLLELHCPKLISKKRFTIDVEGFTWEVDVFEGKLDGLILAELEVEHEEIKFPRPTWITEDVSTDPNYFNAVLIDKC